MNNHDKHRKPLIGILATPFIHKDSERKEIFLKNLFIKILKKNSINYLVIPYNLSKSKLQEHIKQVDGLYFPGGQLGNYYHTSSYRKHFFAQKYLIKLAKKINLGERKLPILGICHGYENIMLIEANVFPKKKNISNFFINVDASANYKNVPRFIKTPPGNRFKNIFKKSKKRHIIHNNLLAISPNKFHKTKKLRNNVSLVATGEDKTGTNFIEIIKYKNYPFYGFQFHPEILNTEMLKPYLDDVKHASVFSKKIKNKKIKKMRTIRTKKLKIRIVNCKKYGLSKKSQKCLFYKI